MRQATPSASSADWNCAIASSGPDTTQAPGAFSAASDRSCGRRGSSESSGRRTDIIAAGGLRLHQRAAPCHQAQGIGQVEHAGQRRGDELADAVADHRRRHHALAHPATRQRVFDRERRRLHDRGRLQVLGGRRGRRARAGRSRVRRAGRRRIRRTRRGRPARFRRGCSPCRVLRALPREHEDDVARARRPAARCAAPQPRRCAVPARRPRRRRRPRQSDARTACGPPPASRRRRRGWPAAATASWSARRCAARASAAGVRADSTSSCGPCAGVGRPRARRLFHDDVGVGAADAERADAGAPRRARRAARR